jgi:hypothetical protein
LEHRLGRLATLPAPHVLVQVAPKPLLRDAVMRRADAVLQQSEEPVNGLRVRVAIDVDARAVTDAAMGVAELPEPRVRLPAAVAPPAAARAVALPLGEDPTLGFGACDGRAGFDHAEDGG